MTLGILAVLKKGGAYIGYAHRLLILLIVSGGFLWVWIKRHEHACVRLKLSPWFFFFLFQIATWVIYVVRYWNKTYNNCALQYFWTIGMAFITPITIFFSLMEESAQWKQNMDLYVDLGDVDMRTISLGDDDLNRIQKVVSMSLPEMLSMQLQMIDGKDLKFVKHIGEGASATIHIYHYTQIDRQVAVKDIRLYTVELSMADASSFCKEALMSASLDHRNVVKFYGVCMVEEPPTLQLVYEYCEYKSLQHVLEGDMELDWPTRIDLLLGAADGMAYLHEQGIVHRDLKTENLLVQAEEVGTDDEIRLVAKVCDFGLSRLKPAFEKKASGMYKSIEFEGMSERLSRKMRRDTNRPRTVSEVHVITDDKTSNGGANSPSSSSNAGAEGTRNYNKSIVDADYSTNSSLNSEESRNWQATVMTTQVGTLPYLPPEILVNMSIGATGIVVD